MPAVAIDDAVEMVSQQFEEQTDVTSCSNISPGNSDGNVRAETTPDRSPSKRRRTSGTVAESSQDDSKFHNVNVEDIVIIEICAGSARLTKAARTMGFKGVAVDHSDKRSCGIDICIFDLTDNTQLSNLLDYIHKDASRIALIWVAPSCGTASRARERPIPGHKSCPKPLRSLLQPDGLDSLAGWDKYKVETANQLYDAVYAITHCAVQLGICVAIENPTNSHYWNVASTLKIRKEFGDSFVTFHACAHGGTRDKSTSIWQSQHYFDSLALKCDRKHSHASWKPAMKDGRLQFPTAEEAAYPHLLCERIIACVMTQVLKLGAVSIESFHKQIELQQSTQQRRIAMGALPRGNKIKPLVAEFQRYDTLPCDPQQQPKQIDAKLRSYPKGARVTHRRLINGDEFRGSEVFLKLGQADRAVFTQCESVEICTVGVPAEPLVFLDRAIEAGHPRGVEVHVEEFIHNAVLENFHSPPYELAKKRLTFFKRWQERAKVIDSEGDSFIKQAPEHAQRILHGKRLQLWDEILKDLGYMDSHLVSDVANGFELTGWMRKTGIFPAGVKRPSFSVETLAKLSKGLNRAILKSMDRRQEDELEQGTWSETAEELEKGWVWDASSEGLDGKILARRFGLQQGSKLRVIDDCRHLNFSVGLNEKFQLHSIDQLASIIAHSFSLLDGGQHPNVFGRTYDLRAAYKQFPLSVASRSTLRIAVAKPGSSAPTILGVNALPFGAVGSVAGFLRVSHALWYVGTVGLGLCWTAFYDDFSVLTREELLHSTASSCELLFRLLGIDFADTGKKAVPFSQNFKMLGVLVNTESSRKSSVTIAHTDERRAELVSSLESVLCRGSLTPKEAEKLRGRMVFFEGYTFGRIANAAVKNLGRLGMNQAETNVLSDDLSNILNFLKWRVANASPMKIEKCFTSTWVVFTDGCCEAERRFGGIGGILISPSGTCVQYFSAEVPPWMMDILLETSANPIHELELLPIYLAAFVWKQFLGLSQVVWYVDNESSRMAVVRGSGETRNAASIIDAFVRLECSSQVKSWFSRVPSHSNLADGVSRLCCELPRSLGAGQTTIEWESHRSLVISEGRGSGGSG